MGSGMQPSADRGIPQTSSEPANTATASQSAASRSATGVQQGGQPQRYPDPSLGQVPGQYQVNLPAASPSGQQEHPRPFTSLMQGHAGIPSLSMHGQPGGTQAGSQANMCSPGVPGNGMAQPRPQSGVPHMVLGQQTPGQGPGQTLGQQLGLPKAVPGQLQYHPPLGGQQRPPYQHYTSPPLTVQQIQQLQHLQAQQQQQLQMRASGSQQMRPAGAQRGTPQSPPLAGLPRAPMPAHMQPGQQHAQRGQPGADGQRAHVGHAMPRPAAQPGQAPQPMAAAAAMPQPRPQNTRNTVVHHAPPMQLQVAQQQQMQMQGQHGQPGPMPQRSPGSMPAVPGSEGRTPNSVQLQTLQSPPRPRPSPKVSKVVTLSGPIKKHCNCKNSRCLKLYCECFASGRYCDNCNCVNCCNNKESEQVRQAAVEAILERNPNAFRPKIQGGDDSAAALATGPAARHNKGCNCKKSGCLKKYCECFQASIYCSDNCKCIDCKNFEGSDAREMVMMSLVHEHNRSMNAHHAAKRARIAAGHTPPQPQFSGNAAAGSISMQMGARGAMPSIPGGMQMQQGPPGPMTQLLQQDGPPPPLHSLSAPMTAPGGSEAVSGAATSMTQQMGGSPMPSPRPASSGPRQPLKPLVHSRAVLQETMREMVNRGGVAEMASLLLLIAQETEQKMTAKPEADGEVNADAEKPNAAEGSSSGGGAPDKTHSSYSGPSRVYAAQEKAVLQEFHFILKKVSDRVLKKTAQEVEQTAVAKATASAALAAVPGNLLNHPSGMPSPAPSPRMQQPPSSPFPLGVQQSPGQMRVLHIAQSPHGARPAGAQQIPQQRMVNLSAYGRPGGPSPTSSPGLVQLQMGQARQQAAAPSAPHQPWQALMQTGHLASPQGGPRPGTVMYSAPPGGPMYTPQSAGQQPVSIRLSNYSGPTTLILPSSAAPPVSMQQPSLAPQSQVVSGAMAAAGFLLPHQRVPATQSQAGHLGQPGQPQQTGAGQPGPRLPSFAQMVMGHMPGQPSNQPLPQTGQSQQQMGQPSAVKQEQALGQSPGLSAPQQPQQQQPSAATPHGTPATGV